MKKQLILFVLFFTTLVSLESCGIYSFTGTNLDCDKYKTVSVAYFPNEAPEVVSGLSEDITTKLQNMLLSQTCLTLVKEDADLIFEGEIMSYTILPTTQTAAATAAENRMTIGVRVRYTDTKDDEQSWEKNYSFYYNFDANALPSSIQREANEEIFGNITKQIFNDSVANW
jgi:hypothetical protein